MKLSTLFLLLLYVVCFAYWSEYVKASSLSSDIKYPYPIEASWFADRFSK